MAHLRRGGAQVETLRVDSEPAFRAALRGALGHRPVRLQRARLLRPGRARHRQVARPPAAVHPDLGRDRRGRRGRRDAQRRQRLPAEGQPRAPGAGRRARDRRARGAAGARAGRPAAGAVAPAAVRAGAASADQRRQRARRDRARDPRRRRRLAHRAEVRHRLDRPPFQGRRRCSSARRPRWKWSLTPSSPASGSCTTCTRRSWSRAWSRRCSGWPRASRSAPASRAPSAPATRRCSCRPACRWWRTARRRRRSPTSPSTPTRRGCSIDLSLAGGVLSLEISDNGVGLRDADLAKARSFGIRGLHERASHGRRLGRPVQRPPGHHADPVGAAGRRRRATRPSSGRTPTTTRPPFEDSDDPIGLGSAYDPRHPLRRPCADPARHPRHPVRRARHRGRRRGRRLPRAAHAAAQPHRATCWCWTSTCRAAAASTCWPCSRTRAPR